MAEVSYTADEGGFQPESSLIPVAPAFPHPIPLFVQEQIIFAEEQRRLKALEEQQAQEENKAEEEAK